MESPQEDAGFFMENCLSFCEVQATVYAEPMFLHLPFGEGNGDATSFARRPPTDIRNEQKGGGDRCSSLCGKGPLCISEQFHKTNSYFVPYAEPGGTFLLKPLQVTPKTKIKRNQLQIKSRGRRASASAPLKGSLTIEAAFAMCLLLAACVHLFYLFSLMGFQARMQLFPGKRNQGAGHLPDQPQRGNAGGRRKELEPFSGLMSLDEGVSFQAEKDGDFLEASVQYRAGPAFGLWKADYTQTARRRL